MVAIGISARRGVALTAALLGLSAGLGAAAAQAAPAAPARPAVTGVTWTNLALANGWVSEQSAWNSGNPAYAVKGGITYLSGSLAQPSPGGAVFATLPAPARPSRVLYITVYTFGGSHGWLRIYPDGRMSAFSNDGGSPDHAQSFTSLAAVSFPAAGFKTKPLALKSGWLSSDSSYSTGDPSYAVSGGIAYLAGSAKQPVGTNSLITVLPKAARSAHLITMTVYTYGGTTGEFEVYPNGNVYAFNGGARDYTSLAGISYPLAGVVPVKLKLINSWVAGNTGTGAPSYSVAGGVVYLSGTLRSSKTVNKFAVLPAAARPKHAVYIKVEEMGGAVGYLYINPVNGWMYLYGPFNAAFTFSSLAGISYPLGS